MASAGDDRAGNVQPDRSRARSQQGNSIERRSLPEWRVSLRGDDDSDLVYVIQSIEELTPLNKDECINSALRSHHHGSATLLVTHRERAELYEQQFAARNINVCVEPVGN